MIYIFMYLINIFFLSSRKVFFMSFNGKSYSDNPRAISEELYKKNKNLKIVWAFNKSYDNISDVPSYVKIVRINTIKYFYHLATSRVWIDNFLKPIYLYKSKRQFYIQTWHGDRAIKKILLDTKLKKSNINRRIFEQKNCDLILTGSKFGEKMYRTSMNYNGNYLKVGSPRNDILLSTSKKDVYNKIFRVKDSDRILLFAPTFREGESEYDIRNINFDRVKNVLESKTGNNWKIFIRVHASTNNIKGINQSVVNVSSYPEMSHLLYISDMLITDYSSSATDFILTNKPIVLYQPDIEDYSENQRELYFEMNKIPFVTAKSFEELLEKIVKSIDDDNQNRNQKIRDFYKVYESGFASEKVAKYILNELSIE